MKYDRIIIILTASLLTKSKNWDCEIYAKYTKRAQIAMEV